MANAFLTIVISASFGAVAGFIANIVMQGRARHLDMQTYASALVREMLLITRKLEEYVKTLQEYNERRREGAVSNVPGHSLTSEDLLIFQTNTSKIGLLEKPFALSTLKFYQQVRDVMRTDVWEDGDRDFTNWSQYEEVARYGQNLMRQLEMVSSVPYRKIVRQAIKRRKGIPPDGNDREGRKASKTENRDPDFTPHPHPTDRPESQD